MLFNSLEFILIYLPVVFVVYFFLNSKKLVQLAKGWLVIASLFFYSYWKPDYLPLILFSMIFNYSIGSTIINQEKLNLKINKKIPLLIGIIGNVGLLAYYKYFDFLITNLNIVLKSDFNYLNIVLPLGISFFTFTQIAYIVDAYKAEAKEVDFVNYALFVTYFPHLIAGPILHHKEMMPQFNKLRNKIINPKNISIGIFLFAVGIFKKVIIADNLSSFVHQGFDIQQSLSFIEAWLVSFSYAFQLYFDFSGYTDMALGISCMFNIFLPQNFNSPYKASNIQDFWKRWHMTLSRFLRDYIYIPIGGNRLGEFKTYINLIITFLIGGIWHGAAWTFVLWGMLHGTGLVVQRLWSKLNIKMHNTFAVIFTFVFVNIGWVFFRAKDFNSAMKVLGGMFGFSGFVLPKFNKFLIKFPDEMQVQWLILLICFVMVFALKNSNELAAKFKPSKIYLVLIIIFTYFSIMNLNKISEFLYFQF